MTIMHLETKHIDDWHSFIESNGIEFIGVDLNDIETMQKTIWNTGNSSSPIELPTERHGVVAFKHDGDIWFGQMCCGMDYTPYLALAWMEFFPDCQSLPDQFIVTGTNLRSGYIEACLSKKDARRVYAMIEQTIDGERRRLAYLEADLKEARK
jgi:hypothetical protein